MKKQLSIMFLAENIFKLLCICVMLDVSIIQSNNNMHSIKKRFLQNPVENKAEATLKFLIEEYEHEASSLFIQEYMPEFVVVLKSLNNEQQHNKEYEQLFLMLLMENYRANICSLQYKFAYVIAHINETIGYWLGQQDNQLFYTFHKNPTKWFNQESATNEIQRHIEALEKIEHEYTVSLGQLVQHKNALPLYSDKLTYELLITASKELHTICGNIVENVLQINQKQTDDYKNFFKMVYLLSVEQENIVNNLLKPIKEHEKPHHIERYWLQYFLGLGLSIFLIQQKNNSTSELNRLMKKYDLLTYEKRFLESCKQNFAVPFQRLGNTLFGFPLDVSSDYPTKFGPLVASYRKASADSSELANRGFDKIPSDFGIKITTEIPWIGFNEYYVPQATQKEQDLFCQTNPMLSYFLYMILRGKADILLSFLNMTHEIDLMLKIIASIPAVALMYGGYKGIQRLCQCGSYANYKPLHAALIDLEQCVVEASLGEEVHSKDTNDYMQGKLFFLKYRVKKIASKLLSTRVYKLFIKDMQKVKWVKNHSADYTKMINVIIKKYNIASRANA